MSERTGIGGAMATMAKDLRAELDAIKASGATPVSPAISPDEMDTIIKLAEYQDYYRDQASGANRRLEAAVHRLNDAEEEARIARGEQAAAESNARRYLRAIASALDLDSVKYASEEDLAAAVRSRILPERERRAKAAAERTAAAAAKAEADRQAQRERCPHCASVSGRFTDHVAPDGSVKRECHDCANVRPLGVLCGECNSLIRTSAAPSSLPGVQYCANCDRYTEWRRPHKKPGQI